jgi:hypothetical protein
LRKCAAGRTETAVIAGSVQELTARPDRASNVLARRRGSTVATGLECGAYSFN